MMKNMDLRNQIHEYLAEHEYGNQEEMQKYIDIFEGVWKSLFLPEIRTNFFYYRVQFCKGCKIALHHDEVKKLDIWTIWKRTEECEYILLDKLLAVLDSIYYK